MGIIRNYIDKMRTTRLIKNMAHSLVEEAIEKRDVLMLMLICESDGLRLTDIKKEKRIMIEIENYNLMSPECSITKEVNKGTSESPDWRINSSAPEPVKHGVTTPELELLVSEFMNLDLKEAAADAFLLGISKPEPGETA